MNTQPATGPVPKSAQILAGSLIPDRLPERLGWLAPRRFPRDCETAASSRETVDGFSCSLLFSTSKAGEKLANRRTCRACFRCVDIFFEKCSSISQQFKFNLYQNDGLRLDDEFLIDELQSFQAQVTIIEFQNFLVVRLLVNDSLVLLNLFLVVRSDLGLAVVRQERLSTVDSIVVFLVFFFSRKEERIVDIFLSAFVLEVDIEDELFPLVFSESAVQDDEVSDEHVLRIDVAIVGEEVAEGAVAGSAVVVRVVSAHDGSGQRNADAQHPEAARPVEQRGVPGQPSCTCRSARPASCAGSTPGPFPGSGPDLRPSFCVETPTTGSPLRSH